MSWNEKLAATKTMIDKVLQKGFSRKLQLQHSKILQSHTFATC